MIYIEAQPEPENFNLTVRQKGLVYLHESNIDLNKPLPSKTKVSPFWRECMLDLHTSYKGICAYMGVYFEAVLGGTSVDHFIAKSSNAGLAYEWSNYRLACTTMNSRKNNFDDVIDPFSDSLKLELFHLNLISGEIFPNPNPTNLSESEKNSVLLKVRSTIDRLGLDDVICQKIRANWFDEYISENISSDYLARKSPFVWSEAKRQGLLIN